MRDASPALQAFLASRTPWWSADLFTITLRDSVVIRLTSSDRPISYGGVTWHPYGPTITRSSWKMVNSPDVPDMTFSLGSTGDDYNGGNVKIMAHNGLFDGATVTLERAFMPQPGDTSLGTAVLFSGKVSTIEINGVEIKFTVKALSNLLLSFMPRNIYKAGCTWSLFGVGCGASRAAFTATNTVAVGSTYREIAVAGDWVLPSSAVATIAQLTLGTVTIVTGDASGQSRTIVGGTSGSGGGVVQVGYPLYSVPAIGDTVTAIFGCDKTQATCDGTFGNLQNYRGFDFIPLAETAY